MNKKDLTERDICTSFITPAVQQVGWDVLSQIREEVFFTKGRIIVRGKLVTCGKGAPLRDRRSSLRRAVSNQLEASSRCSRMNRKVKDDDPKSN